MIYIIPGWAHGLTGPPQVAACGVFFGLMNRTTFLVDGFNLYHSAKAAQQDLQGASTKWLDIKSLLTSYLSVLPGRAQLEDIYYFSAFAGHIDSKRPGTTPRHKLFIECLRATGIQIELGRFKYKTVWCQKCTTKTPHYEEKETDVAIATKLLEIFHRDQCDTAVLVTGDTDLVPAIHTASRIFSGKTVSLAFPYRRKNKELAKLVSTSFYIRKERYPKHQFADPFTLPSGRQLAKPPGW